MICFLSIQTVIWDHYMSTIAVMGTLFTMDPRYDVASTPNNKFHRCSPPQSHSFVSDVLYDPPTTDPSSVYEAWELVIDGLRMEDGGAYHCRLTGQEPQSLLYHLSVKSMQQAVICHLLQLYPSCSKCQTSFIVRWH